MDQAKAAISLVWKKKNEGLIKSCTSKGNKAGHGGKVTSFFVAISLGKMIFCYYKHYEKLSGKLTEIFKSSCNPAGNLFIQDGDPSQKLRCC